MLIPKLELSNPRNAEDRFATYPKAMTYESYSRSDDDNKIKNKYHHNRQATCRPPDDTYMIDNCDSKM